MKNLILILITSLIAFVTSAMPSESKFKRGDGIKEMELRSDHLSLEACQFRGRLIKNSDIRAFA